jgi:hypothetical protein
VAAPRRRARRRLRLAASTAPAARFAASVAARVSGCRLSPSRRRPRDGCARSRWARAETRVRARSVSPHGRRSGRPRADVRRAREVRLPERRRVERHVHGAPRLRAHPAPRLGPDRGLQRVRGLVRAPRRFRPPGGPPLPPRPRTARLRRLRGARGRPPGLLCVARGRRLGGASRPRVPGPRRAPGRDRRPAPVARDLPPARLLRRRRVVRLLPPGQGGGQGRRRRGFRRRSGVPRRSVPRRRRQSVRLLRRGRRGRLPERRARRDGGLRHRGVRRRGALR